MAQFFIIGEQKVRPGVFFRYENWGLPPIAGVDDGKCAAVFASNWGPVGKPQPIEASEEIAKIFGDGGDNGSTALPIEQFKGGARLVFCTRMGTGGTAGYYEIMDNESPANVVFKLLMKYPGSRPFSITIRPTLENPEMGELLLLDGTEVLERYVFDISAGTDQRTALRSAVENMPSNYFILVDVSTNPCELAVVDQAVITPGTDPYDAGGTAGTFTIKDSAAFNVIQLTAKRQGPLKYSVTIQPGSGADTANFILSQDGDVLETFSFSTAAGDNQVNSLIAAAADSAFVTLTKIADSTNAIEAIADKPIQPGTPPNGYSVAAYSAAFEALEPYRWNVLSIDTSDPSVQMMMQMYLNRIYQGGKFVMGVIGEDRTVPFEMRLRRASAYNDYKIIYVGTGFYDIAGNVYEGWMAAARIAGLIAGTPSNESITHLPITGAVDMTEPLTNYWYEQAIKAGMLTFSTSAANTVWVEYGINSLVMTGTKEDAGWKKIKRAKVRFELFQRLNDTVEGLVGRLNNDPDGRMTVIQSGNGVCKAMIAERKLLAGAHLELDGNNKPKGDSAWFLVYADDIDALEKMYFAFKFRFAPSDYEITE